MPDEQKKSFADVLEEMLKEKSEGVSKCLSCGYNPRRDKNPPEYECTGGRKAGSNVYSCDVHTPPEKIKEEKKKRFKLF